MLKSNNYLALGDSYTIGEGVAIHLSFPYQLVQLLRKNSHAFNAPEIIAKTSWTTDELATALEQYHLLPKYDIITLLIGVNNQYRGRLVEEYKIEFENLLKKAIQLSNGKKDHVLVLSIPDYSTTPFAEVMNKQKIAKEIDLFNFVNKAVSIQYKVPYIDITTPARDQKKELAFFAPDGLHPSEKEYTLWAEKLAVMIAPLLKKAA